MSNTCPECNLEHADDHVFCSTCGTRLNRGRAIRGYQGSSNADAHRTAAEDDPDEFVPLALPPTTPSRFWHSSRGNGMSPLWRGIALFVLVLLIAATLFGGWLLVDREWSNGGGSTGGTSLESAARGVAVPTSDSDAGMTVLETVDPTPTVPEASGTPDAAPADDELGESLAAATAEPAENAMRMDMIAGLAFEAIPDVTTPEPQDTSDMQAIQKSIANRSTSDLIATPTVAATTSVPATADSTSITNDLLATSLSDTLDSVVEQEDVSGTDDGSPPEPINGDGTGGAISLPDESEQAD